MFEHPLEERLFLFAKRVRKFCRELKLIQRTLKIVNNLVRASGSIGANYIEANENTGKLDLRYRLKISRKESKESIHFLELIETFGSIELETERNFLIQEANEIRKILSAIINKVEQSNNQSPK